MSRTLGHRARLKKLHPFSWFDLLGALWFYEGKPCPAHDRFSRAKSARTRRGWIRAKEGRITLAQTAYVAAWVNRDVVAAVKRAARIGSRP